MLGHGLDFLRLTVWEGWLLWRRRRVRSRPGLLSAAFRGRPCWEVRALPVQPLGCGKDWRWACRGCQRRGSWIIGITSRQPAQFSSPPACDVQGLLCTEKACLLQCGATSGDQLMDFAEQDPKGQLAGLKHCLWPRSLSRPVLQCE